MCIIWNNKKCFGTIDARCKYEDMKFSFGFYCLVYQIIKLQNHKFVKLHYKHVAAGSSGSEKEKEWSLPSFYLCLLAVKFRY